MDSISSQIQVEKPQNKQNHENINKRRKLSEISGSSSDASDLKGSFINLNLSGLETAPNSYDYINIPKPIKPITQTQRKNEQIKPSIQDIIQSKDKLNFYEDFKKYNNIDKNSLQQSANCMQQQCQNNNPYSNKNIEKTNLQYYFYCYGVPIYDIKTIGQNQEASNRLIGTLTRQERNEKIKKFWQKKQNRKWKNVRYNVRKDLADSRQRIQGRFVKSNKPRFNQELYEKIYQKGYDDKTNLIENSSWPGFIKEEEILSNSYCKDPKGLSLSSLQTTQDDNNN